MAAVTSDLSQNPSPKQGNPIPPPPERWQEREVKPGIVDRVEAFISKLSVRDNFWHRICSLIWLPLAFFSGIRMKKFDADTFGAILPFKRFNRNWYRAMAGGALLGNAEIAGGMYVFGVAGGDYTVVCKQMNYRFLRPCFGPAIYEVVKSQEIDEKIKAGGEFNIDLEMEIRQQLRKKGREMLVGKCNITFHCTPKDMARARRDRKRGPQRELTRDAASPPSE